MIWRIQELAQNGVNPFESILSVFIIKINVDNFLIIIHLIIREMYILQYTYIDNSA